jgi:hypothetical protein
VRVIAATFKDEESAGCALSELREAYDLAEDDAELAPLGVAGTESEDALVLAGRFRDERVEPIRRLVEEHGGSVVVNVDEAITRRRPLVPPLRTEEARPRERLPRGKAQPSGLFFR